MIDVHCHMQFHKFENDYDAVIKDAISNGVTTIVNTGTSIESSRQAVELSQKYENLYAIVGIHPHHADKTDAKYEGEPPQDWLVQLESIAKSSKKVIGIGEVGMDFWNYRTNGIVPVDLQEDAFRKQIELSIKLSLPLQIHTRLAWDETLSILSDYKKDFQAPSGMFHCFSGSVDFAKKVLDMGFFVGFDGNITYGGIPPGETTALVDLVKYVPVERTLTETDSPFLSPIPLRGQRNTPSSIPIILDFIAKTKGISYNTLEAQIERNFSEVFKV
ncbi:MAG: TatD family hydrolase [Candidatus Levybacteria bacterium]|nr:TatD family hydrolase [Candidatus Levybacteria bacterium]